MEQPGGAPAPGIRDIEQNPVALAKIKAISRVSKVIGIRTIAQCVESDEILNKLAEFGIDCAQGFGVSKPQPLDNLLESSSR